MTSKQRINLTLTFLSYFSVIMLSFLNICGMHCFYLFILLNQKKKATESQCLHQLEHIGHGLGKNIGIHITKPALRHQGKLFRQQHLVLHIFCL